MPQTETGSNPILNGTGTDCGEETRDHLHDTKLLLKNYRRVAFAVRVSEKELELRTVADFGTRLSTLEVNAELAGLDLTNTKVESHTRAVVRSRHMLQIIQNALEAVREDPESGELMYQILFVTYFMLPKPRNRECILMTLDAKGFPIGKSAYHAHLDEAIRAIDRILWGYTARDCMDLVSHFLPDKMRMI